MVRELLASSKSLQEFLQKAKDVLGKLPPLTCL